MVKITMTNGNIFKMPYAKIDYVLDLIYEGGENNIGGEQLRKLNELKFVKIEMSDEFIILNKEQISSITQIREETE